MRRLLPFLLALCALVPAHAAGAAAVLGASSGEVRAGAVVTIGWSGLSAGSQEVELETSLDGGRWLRISPELEANERQFEWHVPAGYSGSARIRLRAGREHEESVVAEIALAITPCSELNSLGIDGTSEWWNLAEHPHAATAGALAGSEAAWAPLLFSPAAVTASGDAGIVPAPVASPASERRGNAEPLAPPLRAFVAPRNLPLRN